MTSTRPRYDRRGHYAIAVLHTPAHGPSAGWRGECNLGCCIGTVWHATEADALDDACQIIHAQEHGPAPLVGTLEHGWENPA